MITKKVLTPKDIPFLQNSSILYASDFRAISESMSYKIPAMWKYENLLPWIVEGMKVCVNETSELLQYTRQNQLIILQRGTDPKISIFERLSQNVVEQHGITGLWVAIPHPKADEFVKEHNLSLNCSYEAFPALNDKIKQKELLADITPPWRPIASKKSLERYSKLKGFIKRKRGSGGYAVFEAAKALNDKKFLTLFSQTPTEWYFEEFALGSPMSIQCVRRKESGEVIVFGFTKQLIAENKHFVGSHILPLKQLDGYIWEQTKDILIKFNSFISDYEGFFGIDFIVGDNKKISVLEANVRMTAATIPTLVMNESGKQNAEYREDVPISEKETNDIFLTKDVTEYSADILRF